MPGSERRLPAHRAPADGHPRGFAAGFEELRRALDAFPLDKRARFSVELVFEEVVANLVRHGTMPGGRTTLSLEVALVDDAVRLTFLDDGVPFDPRERPEYPRTPEGRNRLTVTVSRDAAAGPQMSDSAPPRA